VNVDTVLLDLDDTLVVEFASADEALYRACLLATARRGVHPDRLLETVRRTARAAWYATPEHGYARAIGLSSWEALWARIEGDHHPALDRLRALVPAYRRTAWRGALASLDVHDDDLAAGMESVFIRERRRLNVLYEDTLATLEWMRSRFRLGLVTNGLACLQRDKLRGAGLEGYFDCVVVAGDLGAAKPDPALFAHALERLSALPERAVMVGNSLRSDTAGAHAAGIRAVWLNRQCAPGEPGIAPDAEIASLDALRSLLSPH
jgi:putative hydrolase of the HAD superfamily